MSPSKGISCIRVIKAHTLQLVEQLIGSQSLAGTVERLFQLRLFNIFGICVTLLWLLSPLGSQMSLRLLTKTDVELTSESSVQYFDTSRNGGIDEATSAFSDGYQRSSVRPVLTLLISANMLSSRAVLESPVDQWNNVKVPLLDEILSSTKAAANPWIPVENMWNKTWVSLSGLMVADIPKTGISTFIVETSFLNVSCSDVVMVPANATDQEKAFKSAGFDFRLINASAPNIAPDGSHSWRSMFLDTNTAVSGRHVENGSQSLIFGSIFGEVHDGRRKFALYNCRVRNFKVEGNVTCNDQSCMFTHLRRSEDVGPPFFMPPYTAIEYENLLGFIPSALGDPRPGLPSPVDLYLLGSDYPVSEGLLHDEYSYSRIPSEDFAKRMTTLINTVWQAGLCPFGIRSGSSVNFKLCNSANATLHDVFPVAQSTVTTRNTLKQVRYVVNQWHAAVLVAITVILQICALTSLFLTSITKAPDILGYVSTMTRDNPFVTVPNGGNTLDGADRARHLAHMNVKLADGRPDADVGHVVLCSIDNSKNFRVGRLKIKKLYL
jgi:hypothetical protein